MRCIYLLIAMVLLWLQSTVVSAQSNRDFNCDVLKNVQDVLNCALRFHPDARLAQASLVQGNALEDVAGQRLNPELSSQAVLGSNTIGDRFSYIEFNLAQNFELGGKRNSRIQKAQAEFEQRRTLDLQAREQVFITTLLSLYRTRQIQGELDVLKGALETFARIQKQFRKRLRLSPDQTAVLRIFEIAEGDYLLRLAPLEAELDRQIRSLELALGHRVFVPRPEVLPKRKIKWPRISESESSEPISGSQVQSARADLKLAQANFELARSSSWPDLKLGPTFETQNQGFSSFNAFGLNFSMSLPIYHLNGAGRFFALQGVNRAELGLEAMDHEAKDQREYFLKRYQGAVRALESSLSPQAIDKKHREVESLFDRGLLPGSLVVEVHRQMLDFTKSQNEQELAAVESLARFYAYQGRLFSEEFETLFNQEWHQ